MSNPSYVAPLVIRRSDPARVDIEWSDGTKSGFTAPELRGLCPCAQCVSETTGKRLTFEEHVRPDVAIETARTVGNYALHFEWSDGHTTGIYSFDYLRRICPCPACAGTGA